MYMKNATAADRPACYLSAYRQSLPNRDLYGGIKPHITTECPLLGMRVTKGPIIVFLELY